MNVRDFPSRYPVKDTSMNKRSASESERERVSERERERERG